MATMKEIIEAGRYDTDKDNLHSYGSIYDQIFQHYRNKSLRLLEIGVYKGGSMKLWRDYFPNAEIVGVDVDLSQIEDVSPDIKLIEHNAYDPDFASSLGNFDIIIDDGPHGLEFQSKAIELYCPRLKPKGIMVIEDVQWEAHISILSKIVPLHYGKEVFNLRHIKGRYDDIMLVIRRHILM
jgi:hypothetical protein